MGRLGQGEDGNAGSSCPGRAAALSAAWRSDATPPLLDMSLAGRPSCSMLNCFVSVRAVSCPECGTSAWRGRGVVVDTREGCGYRCVTQELTRWRFLSVMMESSGRGGGGQTGVGRNTVCRHITAGCLQAGLLC